MTGPTGTTKMGDLGQSQAEPVVEDKQAHVG